jgi:hypothetical protein
MKSAVIAKVAMNGLSVRVRKAMSGVSARVKVVKFMFDLHAKD